MTVRLQSALRCAGVAGFHHGVIHYVTDGEGINVADAHEKRSPGYWKHPTAD